MDSWEVTWEYSMKNSHLWWILEILCNLKSDIYDGFLRIHRNLKSDIYDGFLRILRSLKSDIYDGFLRILHSLKSDIYDGFLRILRNLKSDIYDGFLRILRNLKSDIYDGFLRILRNLKSYTWRHMNTELGVEFSSITPERESSDKGTTGGLGGTACLFLHSSALYLSKMFKTNCSTLTLSDEDDEDDTEPNIEDYYY